MRLLPLCGFLFFSSILRAQEMLAPPVGPLAPAQAASALQLRHGLVAELIAHEPDVIDPVCAAFDERGRMYVAEMRGYPNKGVGTGDVSSGTIRLLEDSDGDGKYEKSTIFAKGLRFPMGILPWRGGIIVAMAPDIIYLKDTSGDGIADEKKVLLTGFILPNIQQLVNTLNLDLDGRARIMVGGAGGTIICPEKPEVKLELRGRACAFDPDKPWLVEAVTGGGQYGLARDAGGRWFTNTNSQVLRFLALEDKVVRRNPSLVPPPSRWTSIRKVRPSSCSASARSNHGAWNALAAARPAPTRKGSPARNWCRGDTPPRVAARRSSRGPPFPRNFRDRL